ncbi:MAG TPA: hypothetical protein DEH15_19370 [Marinilabiliales bacterium]|nr:hypothetical protein [Marinilabiliales bacterium]
MRQIQRTKTTIHSGILTSAGTALAANPARMSYKIQNLDTDPLFVKEGASASATDFTYVLSAGSALDNGTGGSYDSPSDQVYTGIITVAGTTPRLMAIERTEN